MRGSSLRQAAGEAAKLKSTRAFQGKKSEEIILELRIQTI